MTESARQSRGREGARVGRFVPVLLLAFWLVPPETRPAGQILAALLTLAFVAVAWRSGGVGRALWLGASILAGLTVFVHPAPAVGVVPLASWFLAVALGLAACDLGRREPGALHLLRWTFAAGAAWIGLHALYQRAWGLDRLARFVAERPDLPDATRLLQRIEEGRAFAAFPTPAALGGFLALAVPLALGASLAARGWARAAGLAAAALGLAGMVASESFTGAVALAGGAGLVALVALARGGRRARRLGAGAIALGLLLLLLAAVGMRGPELLDAGAERGPLRLRAGNFRAAARIAADRPWTGVGPGAFAESYPAYRRPGDNETKHVHDLPLEAAAELGLPAGLAVTVLFFAAFCGPALAGGKGGRPPAGPAGVGLAIGLAAFALHNLMDYTAYLPSILGSAALAAGLASGARRAPSRTVADDARERAAGPRPIASAGRIASLAVAALAAAALVAAGAAREARESARAAAAAGDLERAARRVAAASTWAPWDVDAQLLEARIAIDLAARDPGALGAGAGGEREPVAESALRHAERAVRLSPLRAAARATRARARLLAGDIPGAYADLWLATLLHPADVEFREERAWLERRMGLPQESAP